MILPKSIDRFYKRVIAPVYCSRCHGPLFKDSERLAGISVRCANKHKAEQIASTRENQFFFTVPHSSKPSPYYSSVKECIEAADKRVDSKVYCGTYSAPVPVSRGEVIMPALEGYGKEKSAQDTKE